jgi:hypothetical protein
LVLTGDSAYLHLVGVPSTQPLARADGMLRVKAFRADSSLLFHKLAWVPGHHSRDYGQLMPSGTTQGLTAGQLEYLRRWIEAGAPRGTGAEELPQSEATDGVSPHAKRPQAKRAHLDHVAACEASTVSIHSPCGNLKHDRPLFKGREPVPPASASKL